MKGIDLVEYSKPVLGKKYLNWNTMRNFLNSYEYRNKIESSKGLSINFIIDHFTSLHLDGLIWLLLIGDKLLTQGNQLFLTLPTDKNQLKYIKSLNFLNAWTKDFFITNKSSLESVEEYQKLIGLDIQRITDLTLHDFINVSSSYIKSPEFSNQIITGIIPIGGTFLRGVNAYSAALSELPENIVEHSGKEINRGWGYAGMSKSGKKVNICIADRGIGFLESFKSKGINVSNDEEAIREALLWGYRNKGRVKGRGIFETIKFMGETGGYIMIRSGNAEGNLKIKKKIYNDEKVKSLIENDMKIYTLPIYFPGVQYSILLDLPEEK